MPENLSTALTSLRRVLLDPDLLVRAVAAGRRRGERPEFRRVELRWVELRGGNRLQVVSYDERQSFTRNLEPADAPAAVDAVLAEPYGNWHVDAADGSIQLRVTKRGEAQVHRTEGGREPVRQHDRVKRRMLDAGDPFLRAVGISDATGRVKPSRQAKYRQVEEFLRALEPVLDHARGEAAVAGPLRIVDLGCGNAYLTFAARSWLERAVDVPVELIGVDVKRQSRLHNEALAADLGWSRTMTFVESAIGDVELVARPHVVLALHACDTATDDALARAVRWRAPVILAAPCCHHDLQKQLTSTTTWPAPYGPLARHGILRERFTDALTDAVRAAMLRIMGYRVDVIEFVDSAHTPRNTLLRAVRTGAAPDEALVREYRQLVDQWRVEPALERLLQADLPADLPSR